MDNDGAEPSAHKKRKVEQAEKVGHGCISFFYWTYVACKQPCMWKTAWTGFFKELETNDVLARHGT